MVNCVNEDKWLFMPFDIMEKRVKIKFEDGEFWAPCDQHAILRRSFSGDYMIPLRMATKDEGIYLPTTPGPHGRAMRYPNPIHTNCDSGHCGDACHEE